MDLPRKILMNFEKEKLVDIVIDLLGRLNEVERNEFIGRNVYDQLPLNSVDEVECDDYLKNTKESYIDCVYGDDYVEGTYDPWYNYYEESLEECNLSQMFNEYFVIAMTYVKNKQYIIAFEAFEILFNCLNQSDSHKETGDTNQPEMYLEIDWFEVFDQYYLCIKNCIPDKTKMIEKAIDTCVNYGSEYTDAFINNIEEIDLIEKVIRRNIENNKENYTLHELYYDLLKKLKEKESA